MVQWEAVSVCLTNTIQVLEKIIANTQIQARLLGKRRLQGLGRVLGEREVLLAKFRQLGHELAGYQEWENIPKFAFMVREIARKKQEIIERSRLVLQQAVEEQTLLASELKNSRIGRKVHNQYVNPWASMIRGRLFNAKG